MILISRGFVRKCEIKVLDRDTEGRYLCCSITTDEQKMTLCNVYGPNNDDLEYWNMVAEKMNNLETDHIIMGGDFNFVTNDALDSRNCAPSHHKSKELVNHLCEDAELIDV